MPITLAQQSTIRFVPLNACQHRPSISGSANIGNCTFALTRPPYSRDFNSIHPIMSIPIPPIASAICIYSNALLSQHSYRSGEIPPLSCDALHHDACSKYSHTQCYPSGSSTPRTHHLHITMRNLQRNNRPSPNHLFSNLMLVRRVAGRYADCKLTGKEVGKGWRDPKMNYSPTLSVGKANSDIVIFCSWAWKQQHGEKIQSCDFYTLWI